MHVYVVDDEIDVARTLSLTLEKFGHSVTTFLSGEAFLNVADDLPAGCVLLDLLLPRASGLEVQATLRRKRSCHAVALLTGHGDIPDAVQAMRSGAIDFLQKPFRRAELQTVIGRAEEHVAACLSKQRDVVRFERLQTLSPREHLVLAALGRALTTKQVAGELGVSARTIDMHRANILRKLGLPNISAALLLARDAVATGFDG